MKHAEYGIISGSYGQQPAVSQAQQYGGVGGGAGNYGGAAAGGYGGAAAGGYGGAGAGGYGGGYGGGYMQQQPNQVTEKEWFDLRF